METEKKTGPPGPLVLAIMLWAGAMVVGVGAGIVVRAFLWVSGL